MRKIFLLGFGALLASGALAGCAPSSQLVSSVRPEGGEAQVFNKRYEIVFPAAIRVLHDNNETLIEADSERGRIVAGGGLRALRAVFITRISAERTRVELSPGFGGALLPGFGGGAADFFSSLREQIVAYEKRDVAERERLRAAREQERGAGPAEGAPAAPPPSATGGKAGSY